MRPFIVRFGEKRREGVPLPGRYCEDRSVWTIQTDTESIPLIQAKAQIKELLTKTKVARERDDQGALESELKTKTFVERERDDDGSWINEFLTKTKIEREKDE